MAPISFEVNFDYRCPFARNANEHLLTALKDGADLDITFRGFSLDQPHVEDGSPSVWDDPRKLPEQVAVAAGIVVRDRYPELFHAAHASLFRARHDDGNDLRDRAVIADALSRAGVDAGAVLAEVDDGWPIEVFRNEHEDWVNKYDCFGVPTFLMNSQAVFIRLMNRPKGDAELARSVVDQIVELLVNRPEINEYKHTQVSN